jgi:hypothetical protein
VILVSKEEGVDHVTDFEGEVDEVECSLSGWSNGKNGFSHDVRFDVGKTKLVVVCVRL